MSRPTMTIDESHTALENGKRVNWANDLYELNYVECDEKNPYGKPSYKNGKAIRVACVTNWFGSLLGPKEIEKCYLKQED